MRRFSGKPDASTMLLPGAIFLLLSLLLVLYDKAGVLVYQNHNTVGGLFVPLLQLVVSVLIGAYSIHEIRKYIDAFATYIVDAEGILRITRLGTQKMLWSHIAGLEIDGSKETVSALLDDNYRKLALKYRYLSQQDAKDLQRIVDGHVDPLRAHYLQEQEISRLKCHFERWSAGLELVIYACAMLVFTVVLYNMIGLYQLDSSSIQSTGNVLFILLIDGLAFLGVSRVLYELTCTVSLSNGELKEQSLFTTKRIDLSHIKAVTTQDVMHRKARIKGTTVEGSGHKIDFHAHMTNYVLLRDFLYARAQQCGATITIQP